MIMVPTATPFDFLAPLTARDRSWWRVAAMAAAAPAVGLVASILLIGVLVLIGDGELGGDRSGDLVVSLDFRVGVSGGVERARS